jgi:hypothetical protein
MDESLERKGGIFLFYISIDGVEGECVAILKKWHLAPKLGKSQSMDVI